MQYILTSCSHVSAMSLLPLNIAGLGILGFLESVSPDIFNSSSDFSVLGESGGGSCVSGFASECSDFGDSRTNSDLSDFSDLGESGGGSTGLLKGFGPATDGNGTWLVDEMFLEDLQKMILPR